MLKNRHPLFVIPAILLLAFVARWGFAFKVSPQWHHTDTVDYFSQARALQAGDWINGFPNGYPAMIAAITGVFGWDHVDSLLIWTHLLMSLATVGLTGLIAWRLRRGWLTVYMAMFLVALWPNQLNYMRQFLSETPSTFFFVAGLACLAFGRGAPAGLLMGCAGVMRTTLLLAALLVPALCFIKGRRREAVTSLITALIPCALFIALSLARTGELPHNKFNSVNVQVGAAGQSTVVTWTFGEHLDREVETGGALSRYVNAAAADPVKYIKERAFSLSELWGPVPADRGRNSMARRLIIGLRFYVLVLALVVLLRRRFALDDMLLLAPAAAITLVHVALYSNSRYSFPAEPGILLLAANCVAGFVPVRFGGGCRTEPAADSVQSASAAASA